MLYVLKLHISSNYIPFGHTVDSLVTLDPLSGVDHSTAYIFSSEIIIRNNNHKVK